MILFVKKKILWLNNPVKNSVQIIKDKLISRYFEKESKAEKIIAKSTNINVLLNRVKINQKNENRKKIYFSTAASAGLILFGLIIF
tara:strand:- start:72 stop:329 length:258 start_codon:yes stop_codon:yes gene_type:complete